MRSRRRRHGGATADVRQEGVLQSVVHVESSGEDGELTRRELQREDGHEGVVGVQVECDEKRPPEVLTIDLVLPAVGVSKTARETGQHHVLVETAAGGPTTEP